MSQSGQGVPAAQGVPPARPLPAGQPVQPKSWWGRNWPWVIPVGCGTMLVSFVGLIVLVVAFVFGLIRKSDVYAGALARACASDAVIEALGSPIRPGCLITGNINVSGSSGSADLAIPISGPKGKATIYVVAETSAGKWVFHVLTVEIRRTGQRIDLLGDEEFQYPDSGGV